MRKSLILVGIPVIIAGAAVAIVAGTRATRSTDKFADDLKQAQVAGLDLAQSQGATKYALTEVAPKSGPAPSKVIKKGDGDKAVRTKQPNVKAAPEPVAAQVEEAPQVEVVESAPAPSPTTAPAPVIQQPAPEPDQGPILAGGTRGTGRTGGGEGGSVGSAIGSILGSILRGGVVGGDGDNCDPRSTHRGRGRPSSSEGVYSPNPRGTASPSYPMGGIMRPRGR